MKDQSKWLQWLFLSLVFLGCAGCFKINFWDAKDQKPPVKAQTSSATLTNIAAVKSELTGVTTDKGLSSIMRLLEQADAVHRETWRVLTEQNLPVTKTPFGKVQRALVSSQNKSLSNKSFFLCDRYAVKKDVLKAHSFPQVFEIFEACKRGRVEQKPLAKFVASSATELKVEFYPDMLEEVLGLGPAILNATIHCQLKGTSSGALAELKCQSWAQNKDKQNMISLESYHFQADSANLIVLKGKLHEDLREMRSLEVKIPQQGEITIVETELHAPEEEVQAAEASPTPKVVPLKDGIPVGLTRQQEIDQREINRKAEEEEREGRGRKAITPLPGSEGHVRRQRYNQTAEGLIPVDEAGNPLPQDPQTGEYFQPEGSAVIEPTDDNNIYPPEGAPGGQNMPSPDLPPAQNGEDLGQPGGSQNIDEAPLPPPRSQPRGGNSNGR